MDPIRPNSRAPLSSLTLDQSRQFGQKPSMDQVGKAFEGLFMQTMMKSMRDAQIEGGLLDSEHSKPFQSMLDGLYSEMAVKRMDLGLADAIKRQFMARAEGNAQASVGAPEATLNAARSAAAPGNLPMTATGNRSTGSGFLPISDLSTSLAAQQGASVKATRPPSDVFKVPSAINAPKFQTGD